MRNNGLAYLFVSSREKMSELKNKIVAEIKKIYDPEIPVNIYELGLIYKIEISDEPKAKPISGFKEAVELRVSPPK